MTARPTIDQLFTAVRWLEDTSTMGSRDEDTTPTDDLRAVAKWLTEEAMRQARRQGEAEGIASLAKQWGVSVAEVRRRLAEHKRKMKAKGKE